MSSTWPSVPDNSPNETSTAEAPVQGSGAPQLACPIATVEISSPRRKGVLVSWILPRRCRSSASFCKVLCLCHSQVTWTILKTRQKTLSCRSVVSLGSCTGHICFRTCCLQCEKLISESSKALKTCDSTQQQSGFLCKRSSAFARCVSAAYLQQPCIQLAASS